MKRTVLFLSVMFAAAVATGQSVAFKDAGLKTAVEAQLHVANPTRTDMLKLSYLVANERAITDLTGLEYATNLSTLNLSDNSIHNVSPLSGLVNLTRLYLAGNSLADVSGSAKLQKLQFLTLAHNEITDLSPLTGLTELVELDLALNQITEITPPAGLPALSRLHLGNNRIADIAPLTRLTHLTLLAVEYDNPLNPAAYCLWLPRHPVQESRAGSCSTTAGPRERRATARATAG